MKRSDMVKKGVNEKEVKFYLSILENLNLGLNATQTANKLGFSKQRLNPYISSLKKAGIIEKVGYGVWKQVKEFDPQQVKKSIRVAHLDQEILKPDKVRGHGFQFKLEIPKDLKNWENREKILNKLEIPFKNISLFGGGQSIQFKGKKVHLTNKSIIIYDTDSYISKQATEAYSEAISIYLRIIRALERKFNSEGCFKQKGAYKFKVTRAHYSLIKNALAKQYDENKERLYVYNDKGLYFLIDNSFNLHEAESIQNKEGEIKVLDRNEGMRIWMEDMDKTNYEVTPTFLMESINKVTQNQQMFAENFKSHVEAIQTLSKAVKELEESVKKLR